MSEANKLYSELHIEEHRDAYYSRRLYAVFGFTLRGKLRLSPFFQTREKALEVLGQMLLEQSSEQSI